MAGQQRSLIASNTRIEAAIFLTEWELTIPHIRHTTLKNSEVLGLTGTVIYVLPFCIIPKAILDSLVSAYLSALSPEDSDFYIPAIGEPNAEQKSNLLLLREQVKAYELSKGNYDG